MADMYKAINNSPVTELAAAITAAATTITVLNGNALPAAPNLATLGRGDNAEVILYTAKSGNTISGITRGFGGTTAAAWTAATTVARNYTAYDHNNFIAEIGNKLDSSHASQVEGAHSETVIVSTPAEGWYRISSMADQGGRGSYSYSIYTVGGTGIVVNTLEIEVHSDQGGNVEVIASSHVDAHLYWSRMRIVDDGANTIKYLEVYLTQALSFRVKKNASNGWALPSTIYSGNLPAAPASGFTTRVTAFLTSGINLVSSSANSRIKANIIESTAPQGTAPLNVTSTTMVQNLNVPLHHGWRRYNSLADLGLTIGSETLDTIYSAMVALSELEYGVSAANASIYPFNNGWFKATKIDSNRIDLEFTRYSSHLFNRWTATYNNTETPKFSGWKPTADQDYVDSRTRYGVTTGTATALVLTLFPALTSLYAGLEVRIKLHVATGANPTLNVNGLGAKALYKADGSSRFSGKVGLIYSFFYDGTNFIQSNGGGGQLNVFTGSTAPTTYEGVWIQTTTPISSVRNDLDIWLANAWSLASYADVPAALRDVVAVEYGGYIYVIGGQNTGSNTVATLYRYNPTNNTWTTLTSMPAVRKLHSAVVVNGKIYVMGGTATGGIGSPTSVQTTYCYDIATDIWTTLANMPLARHSHAAVAVGTKIYVVGGYYSQGSATVNTCYEYDTNNDTWTTLANMPNSLFNHAAVAVGTKVYVFAGQSTTASNATYCYDTVANSWTTLAVVPYSTTGARAIAVGTKVYFGGGSNAGNPPTSTNSNAFYVYDTVANTWSALTSMSANRSMFAMVYANGFIYFMGGLVTSTTVSASVIAYALTSATYPVGTFILYRINQAYGAWQTELVTPDTPLLGVNTRMLSHFDDVYIHDGTTLRGDLPSYYGNGSAWVKFKN